MTSFLLCCEHGYLEIAQFLITIFTFDTDISGIGDNNIKTDDNYAFRSACSNGHLKVAQWLIKTFNYTELTIGTRNIEAFIHSCGNGHLEVAQWLVDTFKLKLKDVRKYKNSALRLSCKMDI